MTIQNSSSASQSTNIMPRPAARRGFLWDLLLVAVLLVGAYFRLIGIYWGEYEYLHPDERFLIWVGTDITPIKQEIPKPDGSGNTKVWISLGDYFDSQKSTMNPVNRGHGYYVYGTLPMFFTRLMVEWAFGHSGFNEMTQMGRLLSTVADLLTVIFVYIIGKKVYDRRVGVLAAAFSALAVLQIQQSHFFTMDTFINFFTLLAIYFAVRVVTEDNGRYGWTKDPLFLLSIGFAIALGCAVASKLNAVPVAMMLPAAMLVRIIRLPSQEREKQAVRAFGYLIMAAVISLVVFRVFQPYAFVGPGFFGLKPDPRWLANIRELLAGSSGDVDYPFALQWARRPVWFSGKNLVLWGLGLPLGILAWTGFLWMGWRILKGEWQRHILLWGWTAFYFTWQSLAFNPTMRYQLPIYATLEVFAAWCIFALYDWGKAAWDRRGEATQNRWAPAFGQFLRIGAVFISILVVGLTSAWAYAFTRIYVRPITRVDASRWIYQNIPGPVTLHIQTKDGVYNQPLYYPHGAVIYPDSPYRTSFTAKVDGLLTEIQLGTVIDQSGSGKSTTLRVTLSEQPDGKQPLGSTELQVVFTDGRYEGTAAALDQAVPLEFNARYYLIVAIQDTQSSLSLNGPVTLHIETPNGQVNQIVPYPTHAISPDRSFSRTFEPQADGMLTAIVLANLVDQAAAPGDKIVSVNITDSGSDITLASATLQDEFLPYENSEQQSYMVELDSPIQLFKKSRYTLTVTLSSSSGLVTLQGLGVANESDFDDGLPLRLDGYDDIYPHGLVFQMYWDENPDKLARYLNVMEQADYILFTSNRQWNTIPRVPERYPMSTLYYRELLGCPAEKTIEWCYNEARPGMFQGRLGYELVKTFQSDPSIGPFQINDQWAEEAFTVYDHPKVFIFHKAAEFDLEKVRQVLGAVDFSHVIRLTPKKVKSYPADLMLLANRLAEQKQGGTWSEFFNPQALHNRYQALGVLVWYLSLGLLGLLVYPLVRLALPGLPDRGYPMARITGLLLLSYLAWLAGSFQVPVTRLTLTVVIALLAVLGAVLAYFQRRELLQEWKERRKYFLIIEALFLAFFLFDLLIRLGNPDLWHPWKGGERPMDFSYFNAVLKSTTFPPYDPWYVGGYLNYYYYGFVLVGMLVKWLGIVPSFAHNLILPSMFSLIGMGAFSLTWNLFSKLPADNHQPTESNDLSSSLVTQSPEQETPLSNAEIKPTIRRISPYWAGLAAALVMMVLGNLGTVRMIFQGYQKLAAPGGAIEGANVFTRWVWAFRGATQVLSGQSLPYSLADWYWNPSRVMPSNDDAITEFPFFTVLYSDPHAHLFAMPVALLGLAFAVSLILGRARWKNLACGVAAFILGGLAIGALFPINLSDVNTYLAIAVVAIIYAFWRYYEVDRSKLLSVLPGMSKRLLIISGAIVLLVILVKGLFLPYAQWYGSAYGAVQLWKGTRTPTTSYLTHWGLFLFLFITWMLYESRDWMAKTPLSHLRKLAPYRELILTAVVLYLGGTAVLTLMGIHIAWLVLPLAAWAGVLLLRPGMPDAKRIVLFLIGTGLMITLVVDLVEARGAGRMNTVFKFYLQAWTLFSVSAGAIFGWMVSSFPEWKPNWRLAWQIPAVALVASAALFTLMGGMAKIKDRWVDSAPHSLDGMAYMQYVTYDEGEHKMDLSQDYAAIRWMQENVPGSKVIVEANSGDYYRWFSRYTVYTGLPGVLGWAWHQQQQRALLPGDWVTNRLVDINNFYTTTNHATVEEFLHKYDVSYIILGQLEKYHYPGPGLGKFAALEGVLWKAVYQDRDTIIYEVFR